MAVIFTLKALDLIEHSKQTFENKLYYVSESYKEIEEWQISGDSVDKGIKTPT